jgi:hypothetical protein
MFRTIQIARIIVCNHGRDGIGNSLVDRRLPMDALSLRSSHNGVGNHRTDPLPDFWIEERVVEVVRFQRIGIVNDDARLPGPCPAHDQPKSLKTRQDRLPPRNAKINSARPLAEAHDDDRDAQQDSQGNRDIGYELERLRQHWKSKMLSRSATRAPLDRGKNAIGLATIAPWPD